MKPRRILCVFLFLVLTAGCHTPKTEFSRVVIYYVPFQFTSNETVTPENIKEKANSIQIADKRTIIYLEKLLGKSHPSADFDRNRVRLLIVMAPDARTLWADADGNLLEANQDRRLEAKDFDQLESLVSAAVSTSGEMK